MSTSPIKFVVAGCGHIGKRHAEMVKRNPEAQLVALIDTDNNKQTELNNLYPGVPFFDSVESFLESGLKADVVNIATPNGLHADQAKHCLTEGMHVVIEKPMGLSKQACE